MATTHSEIRFGDSNSGFQLGHNAGTVNFTAPAPARPETPPEPLFTVPFLEDPDYVERGTILDEVEKKLSVPGSRVALVGLGGVGKSQLAIAYAHRVRKASPSTWIFWLHATAARFEAGVRDALEQLKIPGWSDPGANVLQLFRSWLRNAKIGKWLLILDNADDVGFLLKPNPGSSHGSGERRINYLPQCAHGSMIITSRHKREAKELVEYRNIVDVEPMTEEEATALVSQKLGVGYDDQDIRKLAKALDYIPLALSQAAAYIVQRAQRFSISEYVADLEAAHPFSRGLLGQEEVDLRRDREANHSVMSTWLISFQHLRRKRNSAADLLSLMSFFDRQAISIDLLRARHLPEDDEVSGVDSDYANDVNHDHSSSRDEEQQQEQDDSDAVGDRDIENLPSEIANLSPLELVDELLKELRLYHKNIEASSSTPSQEDRTYASDGADRIATADTTAQPLRREALGRCEQPSAYGGGDDNATETLEASSSDLKRHEIEKDIHVLRQYCLISECRVEIELKMHRLVQLATQEWLRREEGFDRWAAQFIHNLNRATPKFSLDNIATHRALLPHAQRAMSVTFSGRQAKLAQANVLCEFGDSSGYFDTNLMAERMLNQSLRLRQQHTGEDSPWTLNNKFNLAWFYTSRNRFAESEALVLAILVARLKHVGEPVVAIPVLEADPREQARRRNLAPTAHTLPVPTSSQLSDDILWEVYLLARLYYSWGRDSEAESLYTKVISESKTMLGKAHELVLDATSSLAWIRVDQRRWAEAELLQFDMLDQYERTYGRSHVSTAYAMKDLATSRILQWRFSGTEELLVEALRTMQLNLGPESRQALAVAHDIGLLRLEQARCAKAESREQDAGRRFEEARKTCTEVLEVEERVLLPDDADTLTTMRILSIVLRSLGESSRAMDMITRCAAASVRVLGESHPKTVERLAMKQIWEEEDLQVSQSRSPTHEQLAPDIPIDHVDQYFASLEQTSRDSLEDRQDGCIDNGREWDSSLRSDMQACGAETSRKRKRRESV